MPSPQAPDIPGFGESPVPSQGTFNSGKANSLSSEAPQGSDSHSIRSAHSVSSLAQIPAKHPEMTEAGLNASVVETVSAWFSSGQVTKAVVIGELALATMPPKRPIPICPRPFAWRISLCWRRLRPIRRLSRRQRQGQASIRST